VAKYYLYPNGQTLDGVLPWAAHGDASVFLCVDDIFNAVDDDSTYVDVNTSSGVSVNRLALTAPPSLIKVNYIKLHWWTRQTVSAGASMQAFVYVNGTRYDQGGPFSAPVSANYSDTTRTVTTNPDTGLPWEESDLAALQIGDEQSQHANRFPYRTALYVEIDYVPAPVKIESARESGSRRLWFGRRPSSMLETKVPAHVGLNVDLLDFVPVSHIAGPHDSDDGWLWKVWQRRPHRIHALEINPEADTVALTLRDQRPFLCLYHDGAWATKKSRVIADTIARFGKALTRTFARASNVWFNSPASGQVIVETDDVEAHAAGGDLYEGASTNEIKYSSFDAGSFTGWTKAGTGSNGSAIGAETSILLFEPGVLAADQCCKFTAGNPIHVADLQVTSTATASVAATSICRVSIDHLDADATEPLYWALSRGIDSWYFTDSTQTWGAAKVWNAMTGSETWHRHISKQIDVGAGATTLTLIIGIPTATGVAAQVNYVGHAQLEKSAGNTHDFVSSRIVTGASTVTRAMTQMILSNDAGARFFNAAQGAFACQVIPYWDAADVTPAGALTKCVFDVEHDGVNWVLLHYDGAAGAWKFDFKAAGVLYTASIAAAPVRGTVYTLACRWTGANGELDLDPYTISIFLDGVKGTDDVADALVEAAASDGYIGSSGVNRFFDGQIRMLHSFQYVPTDAEVARLV